MAPTRQRLPGAYILCGPPLQEPQPVSHWSHKALVHMAFGTRSSKQDRPAHRVQQVLGSGPLCLFSQCLLGWGELSEDLQVLPHCGEGTSPRKVPLLPPSLLEGCSTTGGLSGSSAGEVSPHMHLCSHPFFPNPPDVWQVLAPLCPALGKAVRGSRVKKCRILGLTQTYEVDLLAMEPGIVHY